MKRLGVIAAAIALAAITAVPASAAGESRVRVLHASPDAPAVDVYLDGTKVDALVNVPFGVISDYLTIPAGSHQVTVYATGTTTSPVIDASLPFDAGKAYTVAATNAVASIEAKVLTDAPVPTASGAQLRVVHFSADTPAVDIAPDGAAPADAIVKNLAYPDATDYLDVPADTYDLEVRAAGTSTVALQLDPISLAAGKSYTVFAIGSGASTPLGGNGVRVLAAVDATAAAGPSVTIPPTDTIEPVAADRSTSLPAIALAVFVIATIGGLVLLPARARARR
jgi:hypothetical protein